MAFFESLQAYSTPGKLKNFRYDTQEGTSQRAGVQALADVESLHGWVSELGTTASYLSTAGAVLPTDHEWVIFMKKAQTDAFAEMSDPQKRAPPAFRQQMLHKLNDLKKSYIQSCIVSHSKARLGVNEDKRKNALMHDERLSTVQKLSMIDLMPRQQLTDFQNRLANLKACFSLTQQEVEVLPVCPHCSFKPSVEPFTIPVGAILKGLDSELDNLVSTWTQTLLTNLEDPTTRENLPLFKPTPRKQIDAFLKKRSLPEKLTQDFIQSLKEVLSGLVKVRFLSKKCENLSLTF